MLRMFVFCLALLFLFLSLGLGTLAMDFPRIPLLTDSSKRPSANANVPNPDLKNLSSHGREVETVLTNVPKKDVVTTRAFESWWTHADAEKMRNYDHAKMNIHAEEIKAHEKKMKSVIGRVRSKVPSLSKKDRQKEITLHENFNRAKQGKDKHRQTMREVASDAAIHHQAGNFVDHDIHYVTQMNFDESSELGYRSNGRHSSTAPSSPTGSPKFSRNGSGSSRKTVGTSTLTS